MVGIEVGIEVGMMAGIGMAGTHGNIGAGAPSGTAIVTACAGDPGESMPCCIDANNWAVARDAALAAA